MAACDDYPSLHDDDFVQYSAMCDEIDGLRAKRKADDLVFSAVNAEYRELQAAYRSNLDLVLGLNEMIRELTKHADAMSAAIKNVTSAMDDELDHQILNADEAAETYDQYVKEA